MATLTFIFIHICYILFIYLDDICTVILKQQLSMSCLGNLYSIHDLSMKSKTH